MVLVLRDTIRVGIIVNRAVLPSTPFRRMVPVLRDTIRVGIIVWQVVLPSMPFRRMVPVLRGTIPAAIIACGIEGHENEKSHPRVA